MQISYQWLKEYVDFDFTPEELAHELTMIGFADEGKHYPGEGISKVVTGKIIALEKHPDADKLQICQIDVGETDPLQIVTGAQNVALGNVVPVALVGSHLPGGIKIKKGKLRGVESCGMLCSGSELNMDKKILAPHQQDGILILPDNLPLGLDIKEVLGLNDVLIDLDVTGNRPDCLNMVGIAREVAALLGKKIRLPEVKIEEDTREKVQDLVKVTVEDSKLCPRFCARIIKNVQVKESPLWLQRKVQAAGMRPINNIVDITNLILLELGQPLHAYDLSKVAGSEIIVRLAGEGEKLTTLDGQERTLTKEMLVIADKEKAVCIAGVMGTLDSEVQDDTTTILLEAANFHAISVRKTSKALGLRSEASNRFEKGLDPNQIDYALNRAAQLMAELGGGQVISGVLDLYPEKVEPTTLKIDLERIRKLVGAPITDQEMIDILTRLGLAVDQDRVTVPTFRRDITREADLVEEVARIYGFDRIPITPLAGVALAGGKDHNQYLEEKVKVVMQSFGLDEAITYSFINAKAYEALGLEGCSFITLANPLTEEQNVMRTTLIPGLLQVVATNLKRQVKKIEIFEMGAVYLPKSLPLEDLPKEELTLALALTGKEIKTIFGEQLEPDFYTVKGMLEKLFLELGIEDYSLAPAQKAYLHPGRSAVICLDGQEIGVMGEVHPDVTQNFEINQRVYLLEMQLPKIFATSNLVHKYHQLPKYPAITLDLAVVLKEEISAKRVEEIIREEGKNLIEGVTLFDIYQGEQVAPGHKSLAYSVVYRSNEKTLTDEEINPIQEKIVKRLTEELAASLRI